MATAYLLPLLLLLIFRKREKLIINGYPIYIISSNWVYFTAFACGYFNTRSIFVNARFSQLLNEDEKTITIFHEIGHLKFNHVFYKTLLMALQYSIFAYLLTIWSFDYLFATLVIVSLYKVLRFIFYTSQKKVFHKFEFEADKYTAINSRFSAGILTWFSKIEQQRESITHPSLEARKMNITNIVLSKEYSLHINKKSNEAINRKVIAVSIR
jgi:hypothetical protein